MNGDAKLVYRKLVDGVIVDIETDVYINETEVFGQEFYLSYQSGIKVQYAFEVNKYDFLETEHVESETGKLLYATEILYRNAKYEIVRHQSIKGDKVLLLCS